MLVRPVKKIITSLPNVSCCLSIPVRMPSPPAIIRVMETTPQAIPNMVRNVLRLWAHRVAMVSASRSRKDTVVRLQPPARLLQNDLLLLVQAGKNLGLHAVGDAQL